MAATPSSVRISLAGFQKGVDDALLEIKQERILERIWAQDHTIWKQEPVEISNRLGWLNLAESMRPALPEIHQFVEDVRHAGYTYALLLGMGGSSLAPEVLRKTFGVRTGYLDLGVLDSTDPGAVLMVDEQLDLAETLFIVSTKSGGTVETLSFFKYFYNRVLEALGADSVGEHFIAITDPGSRLADIAEQQGFRKIFLNDPNIGGRYSALSHFGLVPAALLGLELEILLERAGLMVEDSRGQTEPATAVLLGAVLGELAKAGRDKLTLFTSPQIASFGDWVEQLIAESTGKEGKGILPVVGEVPGTVDAYGDDRLFMDIQVAGDSHHQALFGALERAEHPFVRITLEDRYDLGGQFFLWELATAVAGQRLGINPFDQPNVEAAKVLARKVIADYQAGGTLPELDPTLKLDNVMVYADPETSRHAGSAREVVTEFLDQAPSMAAGQAQPGAYLAIQAYVEPSSEVDAALAELRFALRDRTRLATTLGYGPRFLHSTGQLHKGDAGRGLFIQITAESARDLAIPDATGSSESSISFGVLKMAQALGDRQALLDTGRRVLRFHITKDVPGGVRLITRAFR